jgi:hypothetical protein
MSKMMAICAEKVVEHLVGTPILRAGEVCPHSGVVADVETGILEWRIEDGKQPQTGDAKILEIVELLDQTLEGAVEQVDVKRIDDNVLVPLTPQGRKCQPSLEVTDSLQEVSEVVLVLAVIEFIPESSKRFGI